jgi:hypothetical protein
MSLISILSETPFPAASTTRLTFAERPWLTKRSRPLTRSSWSAAYFFAAPLTGLKDRKLIWMPLTEIDRLMEAGVRIGWVLADGLTTRGLVWVVGLPRYQKVYPAEVIPVPGPAPAGTHPDLLSMPGVKTRLPMPSGKMWLGGWERRAD